MQKTWKRVAPYGEDAYIYWFNGIYKIVHYPTREPYQDRPLFHAYYIPDGYKNWGENVGKPEKYPIGNGMSVTGWLSWEEAVAACEEHSKAHKPSSKTVKRAAEVMAAAIAKQNGEVA